MGKVFKSKPIKRGGKIPLWIIQTIHLNFKTPISQVNNNNNNVTASISSNPYITRKLNNMNEAKMMKDESKNWIKTYHKMLKGLEVMIDVQKQIKDMTKIAAEANMMTTEMEDSILKASINNWVINTTNITGVSKDLQYLIESNMENWVFQIQWMLANKLDTYKGKENKYIDDNIWEIQDLYKEKEVKREEGRIKDKEVILIKSYEVSQLTSSKSTLSTTQSSFITDEVNNLLKYMKFIQAPTQTRIFWLPPYYQSLKSRGEQDPEF